MDIFISWSGPLGKSIAEALRNWLPAVIQAVKPFYSPDDIAKGRNWNAELNKRLKASRVGIIVVTQECFDAPWLIFEAGAIANNFDEAHVCPVLFGLNTSEITGPLLQFQVTQFGRGEIRKLLNTINTALGDARLDNEVLENVFQTYWPQLDKSISDILERAPSGKRHPLRADRELLEEILIITRRTQMQVGGVLVTSQVADGNRPQVVSFDRDNQTICISTDVARHTYDIELDRLVSASTILDLVFQIAGKGWSGPDHIYQFVQMLEELARSAFGKAAQGAICPFGSNEPISWPDDVQL